MPLGHAASSRGNALYEHILKKQGYLVFQEQREHTNTLIHTFVHVECVLVSGVTAVLGVIQGYGSS